MVAFPHCKINLGLHVTSRREDGFHNLETIFFPVPWTDILEIIPSKNFQFHQTGLSIPGNANENICVKAYELLKHDFSIGPVEIHLHKIVPMGAGLGGGSSDGAFTLKLLNEIFSLKLTADQLRTYAAKLGSDCSFFIETHPMIGTGRGEILEKISLPFVKGKYLFIVKPEIHVSTAEAYAGIRPKEPETSLTSIIEKPVEQWRDKLKNDFEEGVFSKFPVIKEIKEKMYVVGAAYASMSGSGSAVFGIFDKSITKLNAFQGLKQWSGRI